LVVKGEVNMLFFFETHFKGNRHPHDGRFLRLEPGRLLQITRGQGRDQRSRNGGHGRVHA
jgi:hypothetical protein